MDGNQQKAVEATLYVATALPGVTSYALPRLVWLANRKKIADYGSVVVEGGDYWGPNGSVGVTRVWNLLCVPSGKPWHILNYCVHPHRAANPGILLGADAECLGWAIEEYGTFSHKRLDEVVSGIVRLLPTEKGD